MNKTATKATPKRVGFFAQIPQVTINEIHRRAQATETTPKRKTWEVIADAFVVVKAKKIKSK